MSYDSDHPETIRAKAEAKEKIINARAKLNPIAQVAYAFWDGFNNFLSGAGCFILIAIIVIAIFAPQIFSYILGGR